ncbi:unnamed protein product [Arabidopsis thaliana]|uniref:(thale cress) hypothetical protein n=1 Tax=Arabidopsis thaliana TaxID=3702 RepID=A0A7G2EZF8_ARATH|nr:unnamed protein product [Arabidopsis thaliana]
MENKHNPTSHTSHTWSELPLDLLNLVFERLSFANIRRAKSVCSSWYSASIQVVPKKHIHWLICFPRDNNNNSCTLLNPEEKDKVYKTQDFGEEFTKSVCRATHGSWLLMGDRWCDLYIVNLFTHDWISLPPADLLWKDYALRHASQRTISTYRVRYKPYVGRNIRDPVFWIDEKTKDYVVLWGLMDWCVFYCKKGDTCWNQIPKTSDCFHMVYKDHKLYFLNKTGSFKIFDFCGDIPQQTFEWSVKVERSQFGPPPPSNPWKVIATKLVVTVTGKVLKVEEMRGARPRTWSFRVFEVYSSEFLKKKERLMNSLGDESMLLDQGITVLANDTGGFIRNTIYFSASHGNNTNDIYIFNLETQKTEPLHTLDSYSSSVQFYGAQWFVPSFKH